MWSSPFSHFRAHAGADERESSPASSSPSLSEETEELDDEETEELEEEREELDEETEELRELELLALETLELSEDATDELELDVPVVSAARIALAVFQTKSEETITPIMPRAAFFEKARNMFFMGYVIDKGN